MSLVRAERRRFAKRRLVKWLVPIGIMILVGIAGTLFYVHAKPTPEVVAQAEIAAEAQYQEVLRNYEQYKNECGAKCDDSYGGPQRSDFRAEDQMPPLFDFKSQYAPLLLIWAAIMAMIFFVLGASFVGAEFASGALMNLLTWQPKRMKVLGTKLIVLLGWTTVLSLVSLAIWTGILWATGTYRGNTDGITPGMWQSFGLTGLRGLALILAFAALGFGLAALGRHTGLALGVALAVVIVGQIGLGIVLQMARVPFAEAYLVPVHIYAWMSKEIVLSDWSSPARVCADNMCEAPQLVVSYATSGPVALGVVALVLVLAFWRLRRRDIS